MFPAAISTLRGLAGTAASAPPLLRRPGLRIALLVSLAHGINDAYAAFLHPLLPRIMERLGLNIALAATLGMVFAVSSSVLQPVAGLVADRFGRRALVVAGPVLSGVFLSLLGWAPSYRMLLLLLILGGVGSALFHPPGASYAARTGGGKGSGLRFSVFSVGGALGFALGPLLVVGWVGRVGVEGLWLAMLPVLLFAPFLYLGLPADGSERPAVPPPGPMEVARLLAGPLGLVFGISAAGAFAQRSFLTFVPIMADGAGASEALGAGILSVYLAGQAFGTVAGGLLTDRMDRRRLLLLLTGLALPAHLLALGLPLGSGAALASALAAGFLNMAILPPVVILAQELVPRGAAVGSSVAMGLAWATGSLLLPLAGMLADGIGPQSAAMVTTGAFGVAFLLAGRPALRR
ncbi:MAG: MFS transporter [Longimicrobiales bacterium]|nr:MFS transporter [Longimicrobiales bacterium]